VDQVEIECGKHKDIIADDERDDIRVTAKLWLCSWDKQVFVEAFNKALEYVNVSDIDTLLLSFPNSDPPSGAVNHVSMTNGHREPPLQAGQESGPEGVEDPYMRAVLEIWREVEHFFTENLALRVGVCDFPVERLRILHDNAEVKPMINQLYVFNSCKISQELADFAHEKHIQLLVHHDDLNILPSADVQSIFSEVFSPLDGRDWQPQWVLCYHSLYKMRGIIRAKGYAYKLHRELGMKRMAMS